jgi:putative DNA primase/helicase
MIHDAATIAKALGGKKQGRGWQAKCPAHDDSSPSLTIQTGHTGAVVVHCHGGCTQDAVIGTLKDRGLWPAPDSTPRAAMPAPAAPAPPLPPMPPVHPPRIDGAVAVYIYHDANGHAVALAARFAKPDGGKRFAQWALVGHEWKAQGLAPDYRPIYRLPEVRRAISAGEPVYFVEGEKCADALAEALAAAGLPGAVTTTLGGSQAWLKRYASQLAGTRVCILPDNDDPGAKYAAEVADAVRGARILWPSDWPAPTLDHKGDVADWLAAGGDVRALVEACAMLPEVVVPARHTLTPISAMAWGGDMGLARRVALGQMMSHDGQWLAHYVPELRAWVGYDPHRGLWTRAEGRTLVNEALRHHGKACESQRKAIEAQIATTPPGPDLAALTEQRDHIERDEMAARKTSTVAKMETQIASEVGCTRSVNADPFDGSPGLLCARNGAIDIPTGRLLAHSPSHYFTGSVPVAYDPAAACPVFQSMLNQIMPDPDSREQLLRWLGSGLTGHSPQILAVWYGAGSDGKTTIANIMRALLGPMAATLEEGALVAQQNNSAFALAALEGARFAIADESEEKARLHTARVKSLTGGGTVKVADKFEKARAVRPTWSLTLATNHLPDVEGYGNAISRRLVIWRFVARFWLPSDPDFAQRPEGAPIGDPAKERHVIERELPGVLNLLVAAAGRYLRDGITPSAKMIDSARSHREQTDTVGAFVGERLVYPAPGHSLTIKALNEAALEYATERQMPTPGRGAVVRYLTERGCPSKGERGTDGQYRKVVQGVRWRTALDDAPALKPETDETLLDTSVQRIGGDVLPSYIENRVSGVSSFSLAFNKVVN